MYASAASCRASVNIPYPYNIGEQSKHKKMEIVIIFEIKVCGA